jgi:hypothetical protein
MAGLTNCTLGHTSTPQQEYQFDLDFSGHNKASFSVFEAFASWLLYRKAVSLCGFTLFLPAVLIRGLPVSNHGSVVSFAWNIHFSAFATKNNA